MCSNLYIIFQTLMISKFVFENKSVSACLQKDILSYDSKEEGIFSNIADIFV